MTASHTAQTARTDQTAQGPELFVTYEYRRELLDELLALHGERATRLDAHTRASREADLDLASPAPDVLLAERVAQLEDVLARCVVAERDALDGAVASLGARVTVRWDDGAEERYVIVAPAELGRRTGQVSCDSALGRALLGRRAGERVRADAPAGHMNFTLVRVDGGASG